MTRILFDHQVFSWQRYGGISRYIANIYEEIQNTNGVEASISTLYSENYYLNELFNPPLNNSIGKALLSKKERRRRKWNRKYSSYIIKKGNFDILHPTFYDPYFLKHLNKPYVITVHDMIHELMPEYFLPNDEVAYQKRKCIESAKHIIAISETTKNDLLKVLEVDEKKISVIHHGFSPNTNTNNEDVKLDQPFLLYVGDRAGYKNFTNFATAISPLLADTKDIKLVCVGGSNFKSSETELLFRLKLTDKVIQLNATEAQLSSLYSKALAFIFPSLYEGFGLPILEAFNNNCPIIASDTPCFREIMGNAGCYFDPHNHDDILDKIKLVIGNETLRNTLIDKGSKQLLNFSMKDCLTKTINVYQSL